MGINPDNLVQTYGNYEISSGYETTLETFRSRRPTALVCGNDRMAVGALLALHTLGLRSPAMSAWWVSTISPTWRINCGRG